MKKKFSYTNEAHRAYGVAGMAISLVIFDGEDMLASVDIDRNPGEMMEMAPDFYFTGNPSLSAKAAWSRIVSNFNLTAAMILGNALCRSLVLERRELAKELLASLHDTIVGEAAETCSLEADEAERLFNKDLSYLYRVISNSNVHDIAHDFAGQLRQTRRMSRHDVVDALRAIAML